ncbi:Uncharacterized protein Rs2_44792 [Raphanus sativus]|nr:Uncharacterized protein Rs2_44792 [Raphanus sativus]
MKDRRRAGHERCCGSHRMPETKPAKQRLRSHCLLEEKPAKSSLKKPPLARVEARSPGVRAGEETGETMNLSHHHLRERFLDMILKYYHYYSFLLIENILFSS